MGQDAARHGLRAAQPPAGREAGREPVLRGGLQAGPGLSALPHSRLGTPRPGALRGRAADEVHGQRGSSMQRARRSATRSRFSTSARARTPLLDDSMPPTDDKPLSGSVRSFMAGVVPGNDSDRLRQQNPTSFQRLAPHSPTRHEFFGLTGYPQFVIS